jgi:hypothetical protein
VYVCAYVCVYVHVYVLKRVRMGGMMGDCS